MHGKASPIAHTGEAIFAGLPEPLRVARYHSLIVSEMDLPPVLKVTARSQENEIMGLMHRDYPVFGVQFHPESVLTEQGYQLLENFLRV
jgi:anthranilate synthase/aminodeoxychorismate synthase-like glutamine amidotransferase